MALITCGWAKVPQMGCLRLWRCQDPRSILGVEKGSTDDSLPDQGPGRDRGRGGAPLAAAVILLPWRGSWSNTNVALLLVVVVAVTLADLAGRALGSAASSRAQR